MTKRWTQGCKEQLLLKNLLLEKKVLLTDRPSDVQDKYPVFNAFSREVFRKKLIQAKEEYCDTQGKIVCFFK